MGILGASSVRRRQCNSWLWLTTIALTIGMVALLLRNADDQTLSRGRAALGLDDWFDGEKERTLTDADKLVFFDEPTATTDVASDVDPATSAEEDPEEDEGSDDDNDDDDGDDGNDGVNEDDDGDDENDDGDDEDDGDGPEIPVGETPAAEEPETSADSDGPEIPSGETPSDEDPAEVEETNGESIDDGPEIPNGETPDTTVDGATPGTTVDSDVPDDNGNGHDGEEKPYPPESPPVPAVDDDKTEDVEEDMVTDETDADDTNTTSDAPAPVPAGAEPDMDVTDTVGSVSNETASDTHAPIVTDSEEVTCTHFLQCQSASSARAALPMCDYRATDASQMQYNVGRWVEAKVPYADNALVGDALDTFAYNYQPACNRGPFRCHVTEPHSCGKRSLQMLRYHWQPDTCTVAPFIPDELEHRWAGKRVLFIGDSLMRQMFNSLRYLMREHWKTPEDGVRREPEYFETKSGARVEFAWSKFLLEERLLPDRMELPENNWPDLITKADWVVMNVGHHWHKVDSTFAKYERMMDMVLEAIAERFRGTHLVFRTSAPGYYGCETITEPVDSVQELTPAIDAYEWRKPIQAELQWPVKIAAQYPDLYSRFRVLNVSFSAYRADAHVGYKVRSGEIKLDCLHWCAPGVVDFWNMHLNHLLMQEEAA